MARVTVQVEIDACDACLKKDGSKVKAEGTISIGDKLWLVCEEHEAKFVAFFVDALGEPEESE
ncbi:hypothetical protein [Streptomyces sp. NBC_01197]|uniref:hypothetical protein n=1 Tax=Streptomyces sp. NBC_01197 TaxID=2903768 RepID=UPI002E12E92B|nr:hypothetical protein OG452_05415 [Streptomyces sp. NBC_01197]